MPFVAITRLRLRGFRYLPLFVLHAQRSMKQASRSAGFLGGGVFGSPLQITFWTVTVWDNEAAMRAYRDSGDHRQTMPRLADWCDEGAVAHWEQSGDAVPGADEILNRMLSSGRTVRVRHPTPGHAAGKTVPDGRAPGKMAPIRPASA